MIRIGKMADYALLITNQLVLAKEPLSNTDTLVEVTHLPTATVRKLLKQLVDAGIVSSQRGINGGYQLADKPGNLTVADVIAAIEGPISLTQCAAQHCGCDLLLSCELKSNWSFINELVVDLFQHISLADMSNKMNKQTFKYPSALISNITHQ